MSGDLTASAVAICRACVYPSLMSDYYKLQAVHTKTRWPAVLGLKPQTWLHPLQ